MWSGYCLDWCCNKYRCQNWWAQVERYELFPKLSLNPLHLHLGLLSKCKVSIDWYEWYLLKESVFAQSQSPVYISLFTHHLTFNKYTFNSSKYTNKVVKDVILKPSVRWSAWRSCWWSWLGTRTRPCRGAPPPRCRGSPPSPASQTWSW